MINTYGLKSKIIATGRTQAQVAEKIGMSGQTFSRKINNLVEFTASEIAKLSELLDITDKDSIFFV